MTSDLKENPVLEGDDVDQFLQDIREFPLLSAQEERELAQQCAQGNEAAIRKMVLSNLRLVISMARDYSGRGVPLLDLVQEGSIGLLAAVKKFDYTLNYRFSTYATKWIRQGITRCIYNHCMIRIPPHTADHLRKITYVRSKLLLKNGKEPTPEELSPECGIPAKKIAKLLQLNPEVCSLQITVGNREEELGELLEDPASTRPYEELVRQELVRTMDTLLAMLSPRQQMVLRLHYGLDDGKCYSLEQIGERMNVSKERIRQIERVAIGKLQEKGKLIGLEDFLR